MAMGRGEAGGFTVPAINVRAMAYDTARAVIRAAKKLNAGAFIFEIARSEIGYTEQRPHEYAAVVLAAALREGFSGPIFIQGDHVQTNAKKYNSPDRDKELETLRALIKEEIAAGFYNIDIDTSTLVDLDKPTLAEQQEVNVDAARPTSRRSSARTSRRASPCRSAARSARSAARTPTSTSCTPTWSGFNAGAEGSAARRSSGISKISVQTGTAHGGFINADGTVRTDVKIDLEDARGAVARGAQGVRPRRRRAARRVDAAARRVRRVPAGRRLRDPPRDRLPEHGLRAPAVPGRL